MAERIVGILSGGSGTRLWPLSRTSFPKQFHDLTGSGQPILLETLGRLRPLGSPIIVTGEPLHTATQTFLHRYAQTDVPVIAEPAARNTAPAIALLTRHALLTSGPNALVGAFPADHAIRDVTAFQEAVERAFLLAERTQGIVTLGVTPTFPATGYGYLSLAPTETADVFRVARFVEKPPLDVVTTLLAQGTVAWNAGMFVFHAGAMADALALHCPDIWNPISQSDLSPASLQSFFADLPTISIDYAVMERLQTLWCLPLNCGWNDIGSWEEIFSLKTLEKPLSVRGQDNHYLPLHPRPKRAVFVGLNDVFVVDTPDAVLILRRGDGQYIKDAVEELRKESHPSLHHQTYEERPWGRFEILLDTEHFKSKRISLLPGKKLSYQRHQHRQEEWTITAGEGLVKIDDVYRNVRPGDHITIPQGAKHRIINPGSEPLEFIEVQTGTYFGEDDIERFDDEYGRV